MYHHSVSLCRNLRGSDFSSGNFSVSEGAYSRGPGFNYSQGLNPEGTNQGFTVPAPNGILLLLLCAVDILVRERSNIISLTHAGRGRAGGGSESDN